MVERLPHAPVDDELNKGLKRQPWERAIIQAGILGRLNREEINKLLFDARVRGLPDGSYKMLMKSYRPRWIKELDLPPAGKNSFGKEIYKPRSI
jgi:hypothetical protein